MVLLDFSDTIASEDKNASEKIYTVSHAFTPTVLKSNTRATWTLHITPKPGYAIKASTPLTCTLTATQHVHLEKVKYTQKDLQDDEADTSHHTKKIVIILETQEKGTATLEARLTFFVCNASLCAQQHETITAVARVR